MNLERLKTLALSAGTIAREAAAAKRELAENIVKAGQALTADDVAELEQIYNTKMLDERTETLSAEIEAARKRHAG